MRTLIFCALILTVLAFPLIAGVNSEVVTMLDPILARDLMLIEKFRSDPTEANISNLTRFNLEVDPDPVLRVFIYSDFQPGSENIIPIKDNCERIYPESWIPPVANHPWGFILADVRYQNIQPILKTGQVRRMAAAYRIFEPLNDSVAIYTGVASVRAQDPPLRGSGVRLAILDSGFHLDHEDLPAPAIAVDYADYPDTTFDVTDGGSGHGTHVAGTAFGSGALSEGRWMGMAPDADPIYLKIGNDSTASASSAAVIAAIKAAATWCEADIASMSYGGYDGFNDGSSAEEQTVDWAVSQGLTFFASAGNSAREFQHFSGVVEPNQALGRLRIFTRNVVDSTHTWGLGMSWYDSPDTSVHRNLTIRITDANGDEVDCDTPGQIASPRGTEFREMIPTEYLPLGDEINYYVEVTNHSDQAQFFSPLRLQYALARQVC